MRSQVVAAVLVAVVAVVVVVVLELAVVVTAVVMHTPVSVLLSHNAWHELAYRLKGSNVPHTASSTLGFAQKAATHFVALYTVVTVVVVATVVTVVVVVVVVKVEVLVGSSKHSFDWILQLPLPSTA